MTATLRDSGRHGTQLRSCPPEWAQPAPGDMSGTVCGSVIGPRKPSSMEERSRCEPGPQISPVQPLIPGRQMLGTEKSLAVTEPLNRWQQRQHFALLHGSKSTLKPGLEPNWLEKARFKPSRNNCGQSVAELWRESQLLWRPSTLAVAHWPGNVRVNIFGYSFCATSAGSAGEPGILPAGPDGRLKIDENHATTDLPTHNRRTP